MSTNLPCELIIKLENSLQTPHLHERLVRQALPPPPRLTGKAVAKAVLEHALKEPLHQAIASGIRELGMGTMSGEQLQRVTAIATKLIDEGLRIDDAISVAIHEPAHMRLSAAPLKRLEARLPRPELTGENVLAAARTLNARGARMDDALVAALRKVSAPKPMSTEKASAIVDEAHRLFTEGRRITEALNIALRHAMSMAA